MEKRKEKRFLFLTQEMEVKTQNLITILNRLSLTALPFFGLAGTESKVKDTNNQWCMLS
jgi:hypothetical protein